MEGLRMVILHGKKLSIPLYFNERAAFEDHDLWVMSLIYAHPAFRGELRPRDSALSP